MQHLDTVTIGISEEEELGEGLAVMLHRLQVGGLETRRDKALMLCREILNGHGEMAVGVTQFIGLVRPLLTVNSSSKGPSSLRR